VRGSPRGGGSEVARIAFDPDGLASWGPARGARLCLVVKRRSARTATLDYARRVLRRTFQLTSGIGPWRERQLWSQGVATWDDLEGRRGAATSGLDGRLLDAVARAREALSAGDAGTLAAMMPSRERWRLLPTFADDAAFLDIETDGGETVTAIAVLDRAGPRVFLRGRDLDEFPAASRDWKLLVTFNGLSFDVPMLRRAFPGWRGPAAHVDLRHLWARLGHRGGLKLLEEAQGIGRPPHLAGLGGWDAVLLWRRHEHGDRAALRLLVEYNLHDAVNLQALAALGYNRIVERLGLPADPVPVAHRGDWLLDMSRQLLALG
jgi:uncharacterized protein YprB with RNaseH-like and TPR domain